MNNNKDPYEEMLLESFKANIIEGRVSVSEIKRMIAEDRLSEGQLEVVEELAPMLGGIGNMLKSGANKMGNAVKGAVKGVGQGIANSYNQGRDNTLKQNFKSALQKTQQGPLQQLAQQGLRAFPNDQTVAESLRNIAQWFQYLDKYLSQQTPQNGINSSQIRVNQQNGQQQQI